MGQKLLYRFFVLKMHFLFIWFLQDIKLEDLETNHFVLVHGGGFGAWCWYKTIALLEEGGFKVTAVDLTGSGIHSFDTNSITNLSQYVKPLSDILEKLSEGEKVLSNYFTLPCSDILFLYVCCLSLHFHTWSSSNY